MELDDFKKVVNNTESNESKINEPNRDSTMDELIDLMKAADLKERKKIYLIIMVFCTLMLIYTSQLAIRNGRIIDGYFILILGFLISLGYIFFVLMRYRKVNYGDPVKTFLKKAALRHRFMAPKDLFIVLPLLGLFVSGGFIIVRFSFMKYFTSTLIPEIVYCLMMAAAIGIGFWSSYKNWKRDKGHLLDEINRRLQEFEG